MSDVLKDELQQILDDSIGVDSIVLATADGLLMSSLVGDGEPDVIAAMASAAAGLSNQFTLNLGMGAATGTVIMGATGCLAVHPLLDNAILVIASRDPNNVALLHLGVRQASRRLVPLLSDDLVQGV